MYYNLTKIIVSLFENILKNLHHECIKIINNDINIVFYILRLKNERNQT